MASPPGKVKDCKKYAICGSAIVVLGVAAGVICFFVSGPAASAESLAAGQSQGHGFNKAVAKAFMSARPVTRPSRPVASSNVATPGGTAVHFSQIQEGAKFMPIETQVLPITPMKAHSQAIRWEATYPLLLWGIKLFGLGAGTFAIVSALLYGILGGWISSGRRTTTSGSGMQLQLCVEGDGTMVASPSTITVNSEQASANGIVAARPSNRRVSSPVMVTTLERPTTLEHGGLTISELSATPKAKFVGEEDSTGGKIWESGFLLADVLNTEYGEWLQGMSVLELGSGTGIGGMTAAAAGAQVTLTDGSDTMLALLRTNVKLNKLQDRARVCSLMWGQDSDVSEAVGTGVDLVIGSDLLYSPDVFDDLLSTLEVVCTPGHTEVLLCFPKRYTEPIFFEMAEERGFTLLGGEIDEPEPALFVARMKFRAEE